MTHGTQSNKKKTVVKIESKRLKLWKRKTRKEKNNKSKKYRTITKKTTQTPKKRK